MSDDLLGRFQSRRPLLQHVAESLRDEISDLLADEGVAARTMFEVASAEEFLSRVTQQSTEFRAPLIEISDQVRGTLEIFHPGHATRVESLVHELLTVHSSCWLHNENGPHPVLHLICVIPPQAMPEGWRSRNDVPDAFEIHVVTVDESPQSLDTIPLLVPADDLNTPFSLIMKGGGIKGLAYVAAVEELSKRYTFNWYVGTSAGAITAVLLGAGYTPAELRELMMQKDFRDFFDAPWYVVPFNFIFYRGCYRADTFTSWLDDLLSKKLRSHTRVRLSDLPNRVTVYACRRGQRTLRFDSKANDADAAHAVRCSMSIPYIFAPQAEQGINTYDGGMHQNYPVEELLQEHPKSRFISLYLGPEFYEPVSQRSVLCDLLSIWTEGTDAETVSRYRDQTVIIDTRPIGTLDFRLSDDEKEYLLACGRAGALSHLNNGSEEHIRARQSRSELKARAENARRRSQKKTRRIRLLLCLGGIALLSLLCLAWAYWL